MDKNNEQPPNAVNFQDPAVQDKLRAARAAIDELAAAHGADAAIIVTAGYLVEEMFRTGQPYYPIMSMYGPVHVVAAAEGSTINAMSMATMQAKQKREGVH